MKFKFPPNREVYATSISAVVKVGNDFWLAPDEGTSVMMFRQSATAGEETTFDYKTECDLLAALNLPVQVPKKPGGKIPEIDLEAMDWDPDGGYLWLAGSHSLKRKEAKEGDTVVETRDLIGETKADGNRFLLGRIPLRIVGGLSEMVPSEEQNKIHFAARLLCTDHSSDLLDALKSDALIGPFLAAGMPSKDNGLDIEGLAWDGSRKRLLLGLRGPVLRGTAILLEVELSEDYHAGEPGILKLQPIGPNRELYRQHLLDLDGLGVRDLCFQGRDLLILAGPAQGLDWPVSIYRWRDASKSMETGECFPEQSTGELALIYKQSITPSEKNHDHAESLTACGGTAFMITYDSPSFSRFSENILISDLINIPPDALTV